MLWNTIILAVFLIIVAFYDVRKHKIPNWLNVTGILTGIFYHLLVNKLDGFLFSIFGLLVGLGIMLVLYVFKAIGAGDVKLFAAIGAISGTLFTLYSIMYSIIFAGIIAIIILIFTKTLLVNLTLAGLHILESIKKKSLTPLDEFKNNISNRFPFIYAVVPGVIVTYYYMFIVNI